MLFAREGAQVAVTGRDEGRGRRVVSSIEKGGGGTDVAPLAADGAVPIGLVPVSTHYFDFHHSARDRIEAVDAKQLHAGASAMAVLAYVLAEKGI